MTLARLEAVLFLAREPLTSRRLAQYANLADGTQARTLVRRLNELYDAGGRAFRVEQVAGGFQLLTRRKFAPWLRRLAHVPGETRLSAPALETLAVIAYRQPVPRADIEAIRGVNCGEILRQLMERDLVRISGRGEDLGRPYLYSTTKRFLEIFGLVQLDELPRADALRSLPLPASPPPFGALTAAAESFADDPHHDHPDNLGYDTADDEDTDEPESLEE
jgi:segregation and condensation protein B